MGAFDTSHMAQPSPPSSAMLLLLPNELLLDIAETFTDTTDVYHLLITNKRLSTLLKPVLGKFAKKLINAAESNDLPLLHYAAQENKISAAKLALKLDPGAINRYISYIGTPLHVAVFEGYESMVGFLLDRGADPNATDPDVAAGTAATTPLQIGLANIDEIQILEMCEDEEVEVGVVIQLLRRGADPNRVCEHGMNALLHSAHLGLPSIVEAVLDTGKIDINSRTASGSSALHFAVGRSETGGVPELLIARGINVNATNNIGQTALFRCRHESIAELLLRSGANVQVVDQFGMTILHHLADWVNPEGSARIAEQILDADGDIDIGLRGIDGLSAMDLAVDNGNLELVEVLKSYELEE